MKTAARLLLEGVPREWVTIVEDRRCPDCSTVATGAVFDGRGTWTPLMSHDRSCPLTGGGIHRIADVPPLRMPRSLTSVEREQILEWARADGDLEALESLGETR